VGNGSTKYLNTNRNNNADPQNDQHISCYVSVSSAAGPALLMGNIGVSGRSAISISGAVYQSRSRTQTPAGHALSTGFVGHSRSESGSYIFRQSATNSTVTASSLSPDNANIGLFASATGDFPSPPRIAFYSIGESLNLALLDARATALYDAIGAAI
jgi:hypothetical protein